MKNKMDYITYEITVAYNEKIRYDKVKVPYDENIVDYIYKKCGENDIIINITRVLECPGCETYELNQQSHNEHPFGCLHERTKCEWCEKVYQECEKN